LIDYGRQFREQFAHARVPPREGTGRFVIFLHLTVSLLASKDWLACYSQGKKQKGERIATIRPSVSVEDAYALVVGGLPQLVMVGTSSNAGRESGNLVCHHPKHVRHSFAENALATLLGTDEIAPAVEDGCDCQDSQVTVSNLHCWFLPCSRGKT
jgi:hypothetical protein